MRAIINNKMYEVAPEVAAVIEKLENEINELKTEKEALKLLIEWAEECDFGYDNFPEEYERYKDEIEGMGYTEGMIHIAKRVCQQPVKHAYWEEKQDMNGDTYYRCTNCGERLVFEEGTPKDNLYCRCPNCGAKMDLKDGETE